MALATFGGRDAKGRDNRPLERVRERVAGKGPGRDVVLQRAEPDLRPGCCQEARVNADRLQRTVVLGRGVDRLKTNKRRRRGDGETGRRGDGETKRR